MRILHLVVTTMLGHFVQTKSHEEGLRVSHRTWCVSVCGENEIIYTVQYCLEHMDTHEFDLI